jgi:hypothetical protein
MADHLQQQILESVQATLVAAGTDAGSRVQLDRFDETPEARLPIIHIDGGDEDVQTDSVGFPPIYARLYGFTVECITGQASGAPKAARNLAKQVEAALLANTTAFTCGGKCESLTLTGSTESKDAAASVPLFEVKQTWVARYMTLAGTPDVPI